MFTKVVEHTVWMSAPLPDAPWRVRARLVPTFCRFTTSCPWSAAGLFSDIMVTVVLGVNWRIG